MDAQLRALKSLITGKTGLVIRDEDNEEFRKLISTRLKENSLAGVDEYYRVLDGASAKSDQEWKKLVSHLTVGESYFFRDQDQFKLLREHILPNLLSLRRNKRALNIWSAGCSTGEEAYSLAILLDELLSDRRNWKIAILATDINLEAVEKAGKGVFGEWSFRRVGQDVKKRYFKEGANGRRLVDHIRRMVDFRVENLLNAGNPSSYINAPMDLIVCRNVFIYFNKKAITRALGALFGVLSEDGYLVTGHGELLGQPLVGAGLRVIVHPESVL
jgi:chemotaxis protein methyltransferase CheR